MASWPRSYVAGLFDRPSTEPSLPALVPIADWWCVRIVLNGKSQMLSDGEIFTGVRPLEMFRGVLLVDMTVRIHNGIMISRQELRLVSWRTVLWGCNCCGFRSIVTTLDVRWSPRSDVRAWHGAGAAGAGSRGLACGRFRQGVAMGSNATLRARTGRRPHGTLINILTGRMEHHIAADVVYAVWRYWRATGDDNFFSLPAQKSPWRLPDSGLLAEYRKRTAGGISAT